MLSNLKTMFFILDIKYNFTCGEWKLCENFEEFQYCLKLLFLVSTPAIMIRVSGNGLIFLKEEYFFSKKYHQQKLKTTPMILFDLYQMRKRFIENYSNRTFSSTSTYCICIKSLRKALFRFDKKIKYLKFDGEQGRVKPNFFTQAIMDKIFWTK